MDKKEFLKELDGRGFDFQDKSYTEFGFNDEILNMVYEMYCAGQQAQAVPEGFVLIPKEMNWINADILACAEWDKNKSLFCSENRDMTATQVEEFRLRWCKNKAYQIMSEYKAMIEAQQPSSTSGCPDEP